jgi:hypothetical protein
MKTTTLLTESGPEEINNSTRHFFCSCPNLDLWAVGRSREEAENTLREEVRLLLARCRDSLYQPLNSGLPEEGIEHSRALRSTGF